MSGNGNVSFLRAGLKRGRDCIGMKVRVTGGLDRWRVRGWPCATDAPIKLIDASSARRVPRFFNVIRIFIVRC